MLAGHLKVASLTAIIDYNKVQQSWRVAQVLDIGPLADKWRSFGWAVREIDGHRMEEIVDAMDALPFAPDRPSALIAHTVKGKGVSFMEGVASWHGSSQIRDDELARALAERSPLAPSQPAQQPVASSQSVVRRRSDPTSAGPSLRGAQGLRSIDRST